MLLCHNTFNVLHHNNRIIYKQTDCQYHGEHGEGINRETKNINYSKSTSTASAVSSALEPVASLMATPAAGLLLYFEIKP